MKKQHKPNWLDRRVSAPGPYLALVLSQGEFDAAMRHCRVQEGRPFVNAGAHATTHCLDNGRGDLACVVGLSDTSGRDPIEVAGLLVHEAVHVWQQHCESIGEDNPAAEQEAYGIQAIAQELMAEYSRRIGARK